MPHLTGQVGAVSLAVVMPNALQAERSETCTQLRAFFAEQKLLHRLAKEARSISTAPSTTIKQKLFENTLQGFAVDEEQLHKAYSSSSTNVESPARGLQQVALPGANKETASVLGKRKDSMDHLTSKKPRLSGGSHAMPTNLAFEAVEKLMQNNVMVTSEE